ncbi:MAG: Ig-like domain-containing protein [Pseudomonadota bacterium]
MIWNPQTFDFDIAAGGGSTGGGGTPTPPDDDPGDPGGSDDVHVTLRLVNTDTDQTIATFEAGDTLDPSVIGSKSVSIVADVSENVGSVRLTLGDWSQTENVAPYALFGDSNGDYAGAPNAPFGDAGDYSLKVELFENANASGKIGEQTTAFSVGESDGSGGGTPPDPEPTPPATDAMWVAQDGDVVMQAEKGVPTNPSDSGHANWKISDDLNGHSGDGYLHWNGPNLYGKPGSGALSYEFEVSEDGNYKLGLLGSRPKNGEASDLNNDFWVRMDGGPWKKVFYSGQRETWNWGEKFDVNHQKSPAAYDLDAGKHTLEIAGRSEDAYLDKIHLSLGSLNKDKGAPETLAPSEPDNPAPENRPPVIEETEFTVAEDGSLTISAGDVASDPEEEALSISVVSGPDHGTLSPDGAGALTYTPEDDYAGQDSAVVAVSDQSGNTTQVTLTLETTPENDAPDAGDDTGGAVMAGQPFELSSLLSNDSDPDGDALTISAVSAVTPDFFEELMVSEDGTVTGSLSETATGEGTFEYTVTDGNGGTDTATVTISATAAEEPEEPEDPTPPDAPEEPEEPEDPETPPAGDEAELVTAINIGSNTSYEAADGTVFDADDTGVGNRYSSNGAIDGTDDDMLYVTEAWGPKGLSYAFDVENGDYDVTLHFAEIWSPANDAGVRVFDIAAEGQTVIDDLDVYSVAGARTAYTLDLDVTVEDGALNLDFLKGMQNPKLSALEIWRDVGDTTGEPPEEPPTGEPPAADMTELWLVDTDSDTRLIELAEHTILHSSVAEGQDLSVASDIDETMLDAESAQLSLDGDAVRTENVEPYALFGDIDRDYMGALDLEEGESREIAIDYYSEDNAAGDLLHSETLGLALQGDAMTGRAGEADLFAFDTGKLGAVSISGFEAGDTLAAVDGGAIDLSSGEAAGDDWIFDFGDGNVLTLEDYAAEQLARDAEEEDALAVMI